MYVEPCDVFISHRGADTKRGLVGTLTQRLKRNNVDAFMDEFGLQAGDSAWKTMKVRLRRHRLADPPIDCCVGLYGTGASTRRSDSGAATDCSWGAGQAEGRTRRACGAESGLLQLLVVTPMSCLEPRRLSCVACQAAKVKAQYSAGATTDAKLMRTPQVPGGAANMYIRAP